MISEFRRGGIRKRAEPELRAVRVLLGCAVGSRGALGGRPRASWSGRPWYSGKLMPTCNSAESLARARESPRSSPVPSAERAPLRYRSEIRCPARGGPVASSATVGPGAVAPHTSPSVGSSRTSRPLWTLAFSGCIGVKCSRPRPGSLPMHSVESTESGPVARFHSIASFRARAVRRIGTPRQIGRSAPADFSFPPYCHPRRCPTSSPVVFRRGEQLAHPREITRIARDRPRLVRGLCESARPDKNPLESQTTPG